VANYWKGFNKSGGHDFNLEGIDGPGFELFCSRFCNSMKDLMYLTAWVITRGDKALEFFSALMAQNLNPLDGWGSPDTPVAHSVATTPTPSSKRGRGEEPDDFGLPCSALKDTSQTYPSKRDYYTEKA
jgi:hypothetical protein